MALRLNCTMCGANIEADNLAIRRELVTCTHCSTVLRITEKGTREYQDTIRTRPAPPKITVKRPGPRQLSITAPRVGGVFAVITLRALVQGTLIGLAISAVSSLGGLLLLPFIFFSSTFSEVIIWLFFALALAYSIFTSAILPAIGISIFAVAIFQKNLQLKIKNGTIYKSSGFGKVAVRDIRQIYTTVTSIRSKGQHHFTSCTVYALTHTGKRRDLIGPLNGEEVALYIEEVLEVELGIFNLPVYGDSELVRLDNDLVPASPTPAIQTEGLICGTCNADLRATSRAIRQGYIVCDFCDGLTLLYEPGTNKPILGLPDPNSPTFQYKVKETPHGLTIFARNSGKSKKLELAGGVLYFGQAVRPDQGLTISTLSGLKVKEKFINLGNVRTHIDTIDAAIGIVKIAKYFTHMKDAMSYSGEVDPEKMFKESLGIRSFKIVVQQANGAEICLLDGIKDHQEAFYLEQMLRTLFSKENQGRTV